LPRTHLRKVSCATESFLAAFILFFCGYADIPIDISFHKSKTSYYRYKNIIHSYNDRKGGSVILYSSVCDLLNLFPLYCVFFPYLFTDIFNISLYEIFGSLLSLG